MARPQSAIHYKTRFAQNKAQAARKARRDKNKIRGQTKRAALQKKSRRAAKKGRLRSVSRILWLLRTGIHLSARADCSDPAPPCGVRHTRCVMDEPPHTLHCLAPNWVCNARRDCSDGGGLLHPLFTLTACAAVYFLLHYPCGGVFRRRPVLSNGVPPCGVRTFLSANRANACPAVFEKKALTKTAQSASKFASKHAARTQKKTPPAGVRQGAAFGAKASSALKFQLELGKALLVVGRFKKGKLHRIVVGLCRHLRARRFR